MKKLTIKDLRSIIKESLACNCDTFPTPPPVAEDEEIDEVTPPGEEKLVRKLKKDKNVDNPWALAWSIHDKKK